MVLTLLPGTLALRWSMRWKPWASPRTVMAECVGGAQGLGWSVNGITWPPHTQEEHSQCNLPPANRFKPRCSCKLLSQVSTAQDLRDELIHSSLVKLIISSVPKNVLQSNQGKGPVF